MTTLSEVESHRRSIADLSTLAERDLRVFIGSLGVDGPRKIAAAAREYLPELSATYTLAASTLAADWYEDVRESAAIVTAYTATTLEPPETDALQGAIGYALVPLFSETVETGTATERLANLASGLVTAADRQTVESNAARDRSRPRFARHASANACAFCAMLATRGAEYRSEESALRVTLSRPRNKRKIGEKYHDDCHCTVVPVWDSAGYEEAPYVSDWRDAYDTATKKLGGARDTKAILAEMRQTLGAK